MSKKIKVETSSNIRTKLVGLFHQYLVRKFHESKLNKNEEHHYEDLYDYWDAMFPGWDDDDDFDVLYPSNVIPIQSCKSKKKKHNTIKDFARSCFSSQSYVKKNSRQHYRYNEIDDDDFDYSEYINSDKEIWFYLDYHDKGDRLEFNTLKEFNDYCASEGFIVPDEVASDLMWRYESHCCLKKTCDGNNFEVLSGHSYGDMFYEVCDAEELSEDYYGS